MIAPEAIFPGLVLSAFARALDLVEGLERAASPMAAGLVLRQAVAPFGVCGFFAGSFPASP
ncbi:hypothetical protein ACIPIA_13835, partial [Bosea sp. CER48]|uniref:hypothetical protein n=1 Tax=Bosea sp. CER48 TaxID=3377035 RepID=UPI00382AFB43